MKAYVFPGQGSQFVGMGEDLFPLYPDLTEQASEILGYDIRELCLKDPDSQLNFTKFTQPALYVVNHLSYLAYAAEHGEPDVTAGHSLGEFNALTAAGVFDFPTGLKIVQKRAALMSEVSGGGMAAVVGLTEPQVRTILDDSNVKNVYPANLNTEKQIVISGEKDALLSLESVFTEAGARFVPLAVSGAFHTPYMAKAGEELRAFAQDFTFHSPKAKVIANYSAKEYTHENTLSNMIAQISSPVKWDESVHYMMHVLKCDEITQVGVGNVLKPMIVKIRRETPRF